MTLIVKRISANEYLNLQNHAALRIMPVETKRFWHKKQWWVCSSTFELNIKLQINRPLFAVVHCALHPQNLQSDALLINLLEKLNQKQIQQNNEQVVIGIDELEINLPCDFIELEPNMELQEIINAIAAPIKKAFAHLPREFGIEFVRIERIGHQLNITECPSAILTRLHHQMERLQNQLEYMMNSQSLLLIDELYHANHHLLQYKMDLCRHTHIMSLLIKIETFSHILVEKTATQDDIDYITELYHQFMHIENKNNDSNY